MKRKTFYYISLALPYCALIVAGGLSFLVYETEIRPPMFEGPTGFLVGALFVFSVSAIIWGPLYTWAVIALLFWSRGKSADELRLACLLMPILLACSMGIPAFLLYLEDSPLILAWGLLYFAHVDFIGPALFKNYSFEDALVISVAWALMAAVSFFVGYLFVGIVVLIERVMKRRNLLKEAPAAGIVPALPPEEPLADPDAPRSEGPAVPV